MFGHKKIIAFTVEQSQVMDLNDGEGNFSIREMEIFSFNTEAVVIIKGYAIIEKGEMRRIN
jgi:hypothetical protein